MTNRKNQNGSDYLVGYKRLPKASQFKPGRSGNPKGRPKGSRSVGAIVAKVLGQKIAVTENGETRLIPAIEAAVRRLANDAMRGDLGAVKLLLDLNDRYADSRVGTNPDERTIIVLPSNGREFNPETK